MSTTNFLDFVAEATKEQSRLRMAISGPSGSGKTFSGINILMEMGCENILVIDTEHGSAAKYSNEFRRKFKVVDDRFWKGNFDPRRLIEALKQAGPHFDGIVCDSLTHFWMGPGGMLTLVDQIAKRNAAKSGGRYDSFGAWKEADPIYNVLIQTILSLPCHFVACLRAKSEYEDQVIDGKKKKVKVGLAAQIREGFEYEFDVEGTMTMDHSFVVGKTRCRALDEQIFPKPGKNIADPLVAWLTDGVEPATQAPNTIVETAPPAVESGPALTAESAEDLRAKFLAGIAAAENKEALQALSKEANTAKGAGKIGGDPWKEVLGAFTAKMKTFQTPSGAEAA